MSEARGNDPVTMQVIRYASERIADELIDHYLALEGESLEPG